MGTYIFDIDGTISRNGLKVPPLICKKLLELRKNNRLIFASARPIRDMLPMLAPELHNSLLIGCNGGISFESGKIISKSVLDRDYLLSTINFMDNLKIPYVLDGEWHFSFSKIHHPFHDYIRTLSNYEMDRDRLTQNGITKILVLSEKVKERVTERGDVSIHTHKDGFYDITPSGNNKYTTLINLIGEGKYTAFGNDLNDYLVLDNAEISVFIGSRDAYQSATYYATMEYIPTIINFLESKKPSLE
ncbi:HAD hydrolase family protein [Pectobacterium carotovorum]|uniref:Hydrolase n=1 Tax=Pectobacterium carotovorum TaxID=554 RepID=A0A419ARF4_PECCA|nr:HAD hydrolase family protein [Pectobacterium carotovorum]RJL47375.1 hydrolase [Pectobacterium carotovorum]